MKYEILIYVGYAGGICSLLINIFLFIKLNIRKTFMDLTGLIVQKEMKKITSKEKHYQKAVGYRKKHIKRTQNKNDTALLVKDLVEKKAADNSVPDTQILSEDTIKEPDIEETAILTEDTSLVDVVIQEDFVLLKNITVVHTQESIDLITIKNKKKRSE